MKNRKIKPENIKYRGFIKMVSTEDGIETVVVDDHNLTMTISSQVLAYMLQQATLGTALGYEISKMKFSNMNLEELTNVVPDIDPSDTLMIGDPETVDELEIDDVQVEVDGEDDIVVFRTTMGKDVNNGNNYTEAGLFTENDILFAKKHFPSYQKNSSRELVTMWGIHFQRVTEE